MKYRKLRSVSIVNRVQNWQTRFPTKIKLRIRDKQARNISGII